MDNNNLKFKVVTLGDSGVGKSCLVRQFVSKTYRNPNGALPSFTVGVDFQITHVVLGGKRVRLEMWDTAGEEARRAVTSIFLRGAHGVVLVYDVTNPVSFSNVRYWKGQIEKFAPDDVSVVLVGNKCDDVKAKVVDYYTGKRYANEMGVPFFEASAKEAIYVDQAFMTLVVDVFERASAKPVPSTSVSMSKGFKLGVRFNDLLSLEDKKKGEKKKKKKKSDCC